MKTVKFKGEEYLFEGDSLDESGFVATREQFTNGECSFAHWFPDRGLLRFQEKIGERQDLELGGDVQVEFGGLRAIINTLTHPSWEGPEKDRPGEL